MHPLKSRRVPRLSWSIHTRQRSLSEDTQARDSVHSLLSVRKVLASDAFLQNFPGHIQSTFANTRPSKSKTLSSPEYLTSVKRFYLAPKYSLPKRELVTVWGIWAAPRYSSPIWASFVVYLAYKSLFEEGEPKLAKDSTMGTGGKGGSGLNQGGSLGTTG
jgi:hypothetical protein